MNHDPNQRLPPTSCSCGSRACEEASTFSERDLEEVRLENRVREARAILLPQAGNPAVAEALAVLEGRR